MHPLGIAFCDLGGLFSVIGAVCNWGWFFSWPPAPVFVILYSRNGVRIFYVVLGLFLMVGGVLAGLGIIE